MWRFRNLFPFLFGGILSVICLIFLAYHSDMLVLGTRLGSTRYYRGGLFTPLAARCAVSLYPSEEALHQLDPTRLLGGSLNMSDHLMLTSVIGAVVIGIGCEL